MGYYDREARIDSTKIIVWCSILLALYFFWFKFIPWLFVTIVFALFGF